MKHTDRILITGGTGMVGHALTRLLLNKGFTNVVVIGRKTCDLTDAFSAKRLFLTVAPDYVFHLAAQVYGIGGNTKFPSDVLFNNTMINMNTIEFARRSGVKKLVAMGSGCVYPELAKGEELFENQIWLGEPHSSEVAYAHAKRLMLAHLFAAKKQYNFEFAYAISGNLYGEYDHFDIDNGHIIPSLIAKFHQATLDGKPVNVWGSGIAVRDFSYSGDIADALFCLMKKGNGPINMGSGFRHPIKDIVSILQDICKVEIKWDDSKPDGQLERYYNLDKLKDLGFYAKVTLNEGIKKVYNWYNQYQREVTRGKH